LTTDVSEHEIETPAAPAEATPPPTAPEAAGTTERGPSPSDAPSGDRRALSSEGGREERPAGPRRGGGRGRGGGGRRKVCAFCVDKIEIIDYKEPHKLRRYVSERGKIEPRRKTGTCARHQRRLTLAIKRARHIALLPYTADHNFT
jgi:small subunit ribosomal protein S18